MAGIQRVVDLKVIWRLASKGSIIMDVTHEISLRMCRRVSPIAVYTLVGSAQRSRCAVKSVGAISANTVVGGPLLVAASHDTKTI